MNIMKHVKRPRMFMVGIILTVIGVILMISESAFAASVACGQSGVDALFGGDASVNNVIRR